MSGLRQFLVPVLKCAKFIATAILNGETFWLTLWGLWWEVGYTNLVKSVALFGGSSYLENSLKSSCLIFNL